jgi:uncharacterized protein YfaS (alpha-2-macroglobulin family)
MVVTTPLLASIRETLEKRHPKEWKSDPAAAYLAAAYQLQKQERMANELADHQFTRLVQQPAQVQDERYYFDDPLVENAQALYILARHFPARAKGLPADVMTALAKPLAQGRFTTLSGAYLILAFDAYANALGTPAAVKLAITEVDAKGTKKPLALPDNLMPRVPVSPAAARLLFATQGDTPGYYAVTETGFDREVPKTEVRAGMEVLREYVDLAGKPVSTISVGDEVTVRLKFRAVGRSFVPNVALVDLMPGGFEPVLATPAEPEAQVDGETPATDTSALAGLAGAQSNWQMRYADVREDRVVFYGDVNADVREVSYRIKATNSGSFVVPPAHAEAMYDRTTQARSAGGQRIVVQPPARP